MILVVTQQADVSADLVIDRLERLGVSYARLNCERLLSDVTVTTFEPDGASYLLDEAGAKLTLSSVRAIWYRNAAMPIPNASMTEPNQRFAQREAWSHVLGALLALRARWMSDPAAIWRANQKVFQLSLARSSGLSLPRTIVTRTAEDAWEFIRTARGHVIAKPVTYGMIESPDHDHAIYTTRLPLPMNRSDLDSLTSAPVILQDELEKARDVRVTVIGSKVFAVAIASQADANTVTDWRRPTTTQLEHTVVDLPATWQHACREYVRSLGLEFGAIDLVETVDGEYVFLEINPNGQWGWLQLHAGLDLANAIALHLVELARR